MPTNDLVGKWPMTLRRVRHHTAKWKNVDHNACPFAIHSIRFLLGIIDGNITPPEDPTEAPWMKGGRALPYGEYIEEYKINHNKMPSPSEYTEVDAPLAVAEDESPPKPVDESVGGLF